MARTSKKVEKVYQEANELYNGKNFKDGTALFQHVLNIFEFCRSENEKIVALLSEVFNYNLLSEKERKNINERSNLRNDSRQSSTIDSKI